MPGIGTRVGVTGTIGTYYGAPQLDAVGATHTLGHAAPSPIVLLSPPGAGQEWLLVRVTVRVTDVSRSGETWRAEASLGSGGTLPVAGLAGSHISSVALVQGRGATIAGIVRRAYPTASDQRFSVVPRSGADITLGRAAEPVPSGSPADPGRANGATIGTSGNDPAGTPADGSGTITTDATATGSSQPGGAAAGGATAAQDVTLDRLPELIGQLVRVGGTVLALDGPLATIDDGTGQAIVRAPVDLDTGDAALHPGDVINATGYASERDVGGWEVVVLDPADIERASDLGAVSTAATDARGAQGQVGDAASGLMTGVYGGDGPAGPARSGAGVILAVALAGALAVAGWLGYTRRMRRRPRPAAIAAVSPGPFDGAEPPAAAVLAVSSIPATCDEGVVDLGVPAAAAPGSDRQPDPDDD